jgi:CDP-glucose 4,6-dehydratase
MADEKWDPSFWQGKRVLVTGHTGFIGSWLSLWLQRLGANVAGYALAPHTSPALYDVLELDSKVTSTIGDICDREALSRALDAHRPEIVIHLAAQAIVEQAHANAYETWRVNALGTVALLEALRGCDTLKALSIYTTDKVYDNDETGRAYTEDDAIGGLGMYDSSKGAAELAVRAFQHGGNIIEGTATLRAGNVIGGGDWSAARLVPDCARAFARGEAVTLRHPQSVRPWQHVLDLCYATLRLSEQLYHHPTTFNGAWNIGPDASSNATAAAIAQQLGTHWQQQPAWQPATQTSSFIEAKTLVLDSTKLKNALNWQPILPLAQALDWTASWYYGYEQQPTHAATVTHEQITAFEHRLG